MIPRRLTVEDRHPLARHLRIFVNGIKQRRVFEYDVDAGWVKRYETALDGQCVLRRDREAFATETVHGLVEVGLI